MAKSDRLTGWRGSLGAGLAVALLLAGAGGALAQSGGTGAPSAADAQPTFSRDVAPILQRSCQQCHQPTGIGPMSLLTYREARPWARSIRDRVERRLMPPWHLDQTVGIQAFKNDISLTEDEIGTIVRWVDAGAPEGDPADLPEPLEFPPADVWEVQAVLGRPPDFIVRSTPYTVVANGQDQWWEPEIEFEGFDVPRYIRAAEFKPSYPVGIKVTHHGHAVLRGEEPADGEERPPSVRLVGMGIGKRWDVLPEGVGKLLPPGPGSVRFNLHYFPVGEEVTEVAQVGVWLYPEDEVPEKVTAGERQFYVDGTHRERLRASDILIPPHGHLVLEDQYVMEEPALIQSFRPHMHMRGTEMSMTALYPDGRRELLSSVNRYDHNWQIAYVYDEDAQPLLPRGTVLMLRSKFDNTAANRINPDPDQWVVFGARGVDEMSHAWIGITYLDEAEYDELAAAREGAGGSAEESQ
ncbi:MAG: cytochrome c [Acidobacteria bacterium]|nr:cytochrome c [Acidobacteriota bacterium]